MYFESISHKLRNVCDAYEAASLIKSGEALSSEAICWTSENGTFLAVSDSHIDEPAFSEIALLKKVGEKYQQLEFITAACVDETTDLGEYLQDSELNNYENRFVSLVVGEPTDY